MKYDVLIVGAGPAGIFAALQLVKEKGARICIIDRGPDIDQRDRKANILSGWGGAGAFSDGKITLSPEVGGQLASLLPEGEVRKLLRQVDGMWLDYSGPLKLYGTDSDEVAALSDTKGAAFKMLNDPRVTLLGAFLRRTSLDELPQLCNVLKGDMSLIGPRPAPPREVAGYDVWHRRRLSMKPGITGLWQVGARLDAHFDERAQLDLAYIDRWSLLLDLKIILRTVPAVIGRTGK